MKKNWQKSKIQKAKLFQDKAFNEVNELVIKSRIGRKLILTNGVTLIDFMSCSYLGLDLDPRVIQAATNSINACGVTFPAARTRAKVESFIVLENLLNKIFCDSFTIIFSTLHLAHLGILPLLSSGELPSFPLRENGALFILDKTVHASIQINRALMEQLGEVVVIDFQRNKILETAFKNATRNKQTPIIIADSIGSMGGVAPVALLYTLAENYEGYLYLDDAHGTSIFGKYGGGYVLNCFNEQFKPRLILASSLAKAFGGIAGVIAMPTQEDARLVKKFCQTYIFGGPPALSIIDSAIASAKIHLSEEITLLQNQLWENVKYFDAVFNNEAFNYGCPSPIRGIFIGDEFKAIQLAKKLQNHGFALTTAMYPAVMKNKSILRVALSAKTDKKDIDNLFNSFKKLKHEVLDQGFVIS